MSSSATVNKNIKEDRLRGCILGSLVADCAAAPLHWVYDAPELNKHIAKHSNEPEFHEPFASKYYNGVVGGNSTYGEEAYVLLTSLADKKKYDEQDYKQKLKEFFSKAKYDKVGNNRPVGYRNKSIRHFIESNGQSTSDDDQANCFCKLAALACLYAGHPDYLKITEQCIRVQQTDKIALDYGLTAARLLERILLADENQTVEQIMQDLAKDDTLFAKALKSIDDVNEDNLLHELIKVLTIEDSSAVLSLGNSCHLPDSFNLAAYFIRACQQNTDYTSLIRRAVVATGDNCSRILFVGACVGALTGAKQIPEEWKKKVVSYGEYEQLVQQIIDARAQLQQQK